MAENEVSAVPTDNPQGPMISFPVSERNERVVERMHAISKGGDLYILDNSPFYAFGISYGDTFLAESVGDELIFSKIVLRGGHSTYRVKLPTGRNHEYFLEHWAGLEKLGCTYEGSSASPERLYTIDVPPEVDVFEAYRLLEQGESGKIWVFEEGHYFNPSKDGTTVLDSLPDRP